MSNSAFTPTVFGQNIVVPGVSPGQVSANGLPGNTSGAAIASGFVGEIFTYSDSVLRTVGNTQNSLMDVPVIGWTLQPGKWVMVLNALLQIDTVTGAGAGDGIFGSVAIRTSGNTYIAGTTVATANLNLQRAFGSAAVIGFVDISVATTYKVSVQLIPISAAVSVSNALIRGDLTGYPTTLKAVRIA